MTEGILAITLLLASTGLGPPWLEVMVRELSSRRAGANFSLVSQILSFWLPRASNNVTFDSHCWLGRLSHLSSRFERTWRELVLGLYCCSFHGILLRRWSWDMCFALLDPRFILSI